MNGMIRVVNAVAQSGAHTIEIKAPNPELTGTLFEAMSYLLKYDYQSLRYFRAALFVLVLT